jgi:hypothetical protein
MIKGKHHVMNNPGGAYIESMSLMDADVGQGGIGPWPMVRVTRCARGSRRNIDGARRNVCKG